jgi:hypothetical protein
MTQSFNIPDGISPDELQKHLKNALTEDNAITENQFDDIFDEAEDWIKRSATSSSDPLILHKLIMVGIIDRMIQFHENVAVRMHENGEGPGIPWLKDAGKFQAIMNILQTIECGPNDPMCTSCGGHH